MTLDEVIEQMIKAEKEEKMTVRLHTGDSSIYGAIREQMDRLDEEGIEYDVCPGVSSFCGAAAALKAEYTLPDVSQSVIITRMAGRTPVRDDESIASFAAHGATMVIFLSTGLLKELSKELVKGQYSEDTPAAKILLQLLSTRQLGLTRRSCIVLSEHYMKQPRRIILLKPL